MGLFMSGSKYFVPALSELPLSNYPSTYPNGIAEIKGGLFDGLYYNVSWKSVVDQSKSKIKISGQANQQSSVEVDHRYGTFWGGLNTSTLGPDSTVIRTYLRGVVLQKKGVVSGQAETEDNGVGRYSIVPNP